MSVMIADNNFVSTGFATMDQIGDKYTLNGNGIFVRHDSLVFMRGDEKSTSNSVTIALGEPESIDELYEFMTQLGCKNANIIEDGLPAILDYGNIWWNNSMQRAVVMTAVGVINHGLSMINGSFKQVNEGNYLFTARQWLNLENSYNNKIKFDFGILSHAMTRWINAIRRFTEIGVNSLNITIDCLCIGTHDRDDNDLTIAMIFDLHRSRLNNDVNASRSFVHHLKQIGYIAMELSLNVREIRQRVADHKIEELIGALFKDDWYQEFELAFQAYFSLLRNPPVQPHREYFESLKKCFMPTYMEDVLTNGTNNIKQLYEFNVDAFAGGKQGELFRGIHKASGKPVVLKVSHKFSLRPEYELYREIGALDATIINHNIPQLLEYGIRNGKDAIVMTDLGENIYDLVQTKRLNWGLAYPRMMRQLITALQYMHVRGVCHNDIKPHNIGFGLHHSVQYGKFDEVALSVEGNVYLFDFGIGSKMPTGNARIPSLLFSSVNAHRHEKLGPHTDLYMAGLTWLHLFKELPFKREYGEKKVIEMKAQLTDSDRSIEEFIETHYHDFSQSLKADFKEYFRQVKNVYSTPNETKYENFLQFFS